MCLAPRRAKIVRADITVLRARLHSDHVLLGHTQTRQTSCIVGTALSVLLALNALQGRRLSLGVRQVRLPPTWAKENVKCALLARTKMPEEQLRAKVAAQAATAQKEHQPSCPAVQEAPQVHRI